jgi:hypothetical protein
MNIKSFLYALIVSCAFLSANAQVYQPERRLHTLETVHFTIIFPEESRSAAEYLQEIAESVYEGVAANLKVEKFPHIPVLISPDQEQMDGYTTILPLRIALFQAPFSPNSGDAEFNDQLKKIFMHELTHALSITVRSPFWQFFAGVFSDMANPAYYLAPPTLIEGVTVSFESQDGFGRSSDTANAAIIRQDIIEGKFKSFSQAAGAWSGYPFGIHYVYGGYFSRYLQEAYGMEKYAALWKEMGKGDIIAGFEGLGPFKGAFEKTYGIPADQAWKAFERYMALRLPVVTQAFPVSERPDFLTAPLASDGESLYWADATRVWKFETGSGKLEKLFSSDGRITRLFPSRDGRRLLVSSYRYENNDPKDFIRVYDLAGKKWEKTVFPRKLLEAAWLPDGGIVASRNAGFGQDLVLLKDGKEETLFRASAGSTAGQAYPYGERGIVFLLNRDGVNSVATMDLSTREISLLEASPGVGRVINLYSDGERLCFSYDSQDSLYKLARYGSEGLELETTLLSGGVQYPVLAGGSIYYAGFFSDGHQVLRYPDENPALRLEPADSSWKPYGKAPDATAPSRTAQSGKSGNYNPIPYLLKPTLWFPTLSFGQQGGIMPNGAGIYAQSMDPAESISLSASALYRWDSAFVDASASVEFKGLPIPLSLKASDRLATANGPGAYGSSMIRSLSGEASLSKAIVLNPATRVFSFGLSGSVAYSALGAGMEGEASASPYSWSFTELAFPFFAYVSYSDISSSPFDANGARGFSVALGYDGFFEDAIARPKGFAQGALTVYLPWMNLKSELSVCAAAHPDVLLGAQGPLLADGSAYAARMEYPAYREFADRDASGAWLYAYQDTGISYAFRTDAELPLNIYLRSIGLGSGYRSAFAGWEYLQSMYAGVDLNFCLSRGAGSGMGYTARVEYSRTLDAENRERVDFSFASR